ncbi:hypothetical protein J2W40_000677 [Sphingobium xenophagum]|uniref:Uncharacterized protein n=1 Tax=Sphingobium xenophagum TaxID=121428 RepID=A0ABU1WX59_SPHXE|nr:hypothetical protein [Sphingobium xenophagum]MDR7153874.1 hypothetical protein [Sphingobium xenophagum]
MDLSLDETDRGELSLYFDTRPGELADLEVAAAAAIEWAQGIKAAASAIDPNCDYRVSLVAAKPGSSNWIAKIEQSKPNQAAKRVARGWKKIPVIMRLGIGLAVVVPTTVKPTLDYWLGDDGFSETQKREMLEIYEKAKSSEPVKGHHKAMFKIVQRDEKITGVGTGMPHGENWKPKALVPADQFAEADGLFELQEEAEDERTIPQTLDVVLVTPRLENAPRAWTFRQEGIPGNFNAVMKDKKFLAALERSAVRESLRLNIPMRIRMEIKQRKTDGEWKVMRQGRSVVEVVSPLVE